MRKQIQLPILLAVTLIVSCVGFLTATATTNGILLTHFIDVGQGDAILIDYGTYEMLIDGGRGSDCAHYIQTYVDGPLEVMVATHPDADHIGGLDNVLNSFDVEHIWLNGDAADTQTYRNFMDKVEAEGARTDRAIRGSQITLSTLTLDVLHPVSPLASDRNENSIVLGLSFGEIDFLFTGDIESATESSMVSSGLIDDIDILKVSHHGSKHSSITSFLRAAQPEIAIYSAGANNPYGHPTQEALGRLGDVGATTYGTDVNGTTIVVTNGTTYCVLPAKGENNGEYNLDINVEGEGTTKPSPGTYTYTKDTQQTITATPESKFDHWSGDASGTLPSVSITMDSDKTVTAFFEQGNGGGDVEIYELLPNPSGNEPNDEYIKLHNKGNKIASLEGWILTDGEGEYPIPNGTQIAPGDFWTVYGYTYNLTGYTRGLYLSNKGELVQLLDKNKNTIDQCSYSNADTDEIISCHY